MSVIDHRDCRNRLRKATRPGKTIPVLGNRFKLHKSFTCAGGNLNHDTCTGDGGSPLVCAKKGTVGKDKRYVQVSQLQYKAGCLPLKEKTDFSVVLNDIYIFYRLALYHGESDVQMAILEFMLMSSRDWNSLKIK